MTRCSLVCAYRRFGEQTACIVRLQMKWKHGIHCEVCVATHQITRHPTVIWTHYIQYVKRTSHWRPLLCNSNDVILVRRAGRSTKLCRRCVSWTKLHTHFSACNCVVSLCAVCSLVLQDPHSKLFSPRTLIPVCQFCYIGVGWPTSSFRCTQSENMLPWHFQKLANIKCTHNGLRTAVVCTTWRCFCRQSLANAFFFLKKRS